jgi:hypothetical protein
VQPARSHLNKSTCTHCRGDTWLTTVHYASPALPAPSAAHPWQLHLVQLLLLLLLLLLCLLPLLLLCVLQLLEGPCLLLAVLIHQPLQLLRRHGMAFPYADLQGRRSEHQHLSQFAVPAVVCTESHTDYRLGLMPQQTSEYQMLIETHRRSLLPFYKLYNNT